MPLALARFHPPKCPLEKGPILLRARLVEFLENGHDVGSMKTRPSFDPIALDCGRYESLARPVANLRDAHVAVDNHRIDALNARAVPPSRIALGA